MGTPFGTLKAAFRGVKRRPAMPRTLPLAPDAAQFLFIGGLHRSGTSILHRLLRYHPGTAGLLNTGVPEDEGQHLQTVIPAARDLGGPGRFAFSSESHLTERSESVSQESARRILRAWAPYYGDMSGVLLEKSPPNLIRSRFFQALFPQSAFLFIVRHPIPVALATQKWSQTSLAELIFHWCVAHEIMLNDLPHLRRCMVVRYEDFVLEPERYLAQACKLSSLQPINAQEGVADHNDDYFGRWEALAGDHCRVLEKILMTPEGPLSRFGYCLVPPYTTDKIPNLAWGSS